MYDFVFVTHLPSFYKSNLYLELAKKYKLLVIFIASGSQIRNEDFVTKAEGFDIRVINEGAFEERNTFLSTIRVLNIIRNCNYRTVVLGGWDLIEFWAIALLFPKKSNALALESTIFESSARGVTGFIKRLFLSRIAKSYCSGKPHRALLEQLNFSGDIIETGGVGLLNELGIRPATQAVKKVYSGRLVYVGRLSAEKGLDFLVKQVSNSPQLSLTIFGDGPERQRLEQLAAGNITFMGYIRNESLGNYLSAFDLFVLPSTSETWGLVVEEAIYFGLPVLCSDKVGACWDFVTQLGTGRTFQVGSEASFFEKLDEITASYDFYVENVAAVDFQKIKQAQVEAYDI